VLPGHGNTVTDPAALIDRRLAFHEERAQRILGMVLGEPLSAHEIAKSIWGEVAISQAFLTTSEVLGHLELLADRDLVTEEPGEPIRFRATRR
jgi:hypothetical protein